MPAAQTLKLGKAFSSFSVNDVQAAKTFYGETLGMQVSLTEEGLALQIGNGGTVFVYPKGNSHTPASFTILNFPVDDIASAVEALAQRGVRFEVYSSGDLKTDAKGISQQGEMKIAWFKDPAGNFLSLIQDKRLA